MKVRRCLYSPTKVKDCLHDIKNRRFKNVSAACKHYNIPRSTIRSKLQGRAPEDSIGHSGRYSVLGVELEKITVKWLISCANRGFPCCQELLSTKIQQTVKALNIATPFKDGLPGRKWAHAFLRRHPILSVKQSEYLNRARGTVTKRKIQLWFESILEELGPLKVILEEPKRVWNLDETGFLICPKTGKVYGVKGKSLYNVSDNNDKENVTVLLTVNAAGEIAPPLALYAYKRLPNYIVEAVPKNWAVGRSECGFMTGESFFEFIGNVFIPYLNKREDVEKPIILFFDGHKSHKTAQTIDLCEENGIVPIALFPNSTHLLQPLDKSVFGPLKKSYGNIVRQWFAQTGRELKREEVPLVVQRALEDPRVMHNIQAGFRSTGLQPFDYTAINYEAIVEKSNDQEQDTCNFFLDNLNTYIGPEKLKEFQEMNENFAGDDKFEALYLVWKAMKSGTPPNECLVPLGVPSHSQNTLQEQDTNDDNILKSSDVTSDSEESTDPESDTAEDMELLMTERKYV
jgi:hypothetical protein